MIGRFLHPDAPHAKLPRVVWATAWVSFFADFSTELFYGVLPAFYLHTLAIGVITLGLIEGIAESIVAVTKLWSGSLSDRTGHRPAWMVAGYGISTLTKPIMAFVSGGLLIGTLRGMDRLGKGIRGAPRDALVSGAVDQRRRGRAFGVQRAMDHSGALVGGLVAAGLLALGLVGPRDLFLLSAIPGAAAVLVILFFVREPETGRDQAEAPCAVFVAQRPARCNAPAQGLPRPGVGLRDRQRQRHAAAGDRVRTLHRERILRAGDARVVAHVVGAAARRQITRLLVGRVARRSARTSHDAASRVGRLRHRVRCRSLARLRRPGVAGVGYVRVIRDVHRPHGGPREGAGFGDDSR